MEAHDPRDRAPWWPVLPVLAVGLLVALGPGATAQEGVRNNLPPAGRIFHAQCADCHVVPDTRFATDRAWLEQIKDTA